MFIVFWLVLWLLQQRVYFNPQAPRMWGETKGAVGVLIFCYRDEKLAAAN